MNFGYRKLYIDGALCDATGGRRHAVACPGTEEMVGEIAWAGREDAARALESAREGFAAWSRLPIAERGEWMLRLRDAVMRREEDLRSAVMFEMGKPWDATAEDYETVINALQWYPEQMRHTSDEILADVEGTHRHQLVAEPAGVAVAFLAWNFPLLNVGFKLGPALAAGCSLIIRPSTSSPLSAYLLGEVLAEVGFPKGAVNILCGPTTETADVLSRSTIPRVLTVIGSSATGRKLMGGGATSIKRLSMELGGNAPFIVFADADVSRAAADCAALKFGNCGQICVAPNRIFVQRGAREQFVREFLKRAREVRVGFGRGSGATMGPLISAEARERVMGMVKDAIDRGAELLHGGRVPAEPQRGYFFEPTVLAGVTPAMRVFREEIFGPVAAIIDFDSEDGVVASANDTEYGLSSYLYTRDADRIRRISELLEFGEVHVNGFKYAIYLPHGGVKESGIGHDCSRLALEDYLQRKRITVRCGE